MGIKYFCNENLFETWTPEMAYLLGYIYADGSLDDSWYIRAKYIKIASTDLELINLSKSILNSKHKIVVIKSDNSNHKTKYLLRIGSHKLYYDLVKLGLYPNKSLTIEFPEIPAVYLHHFVRGYFDGDGHISIETKHGLFKRLRVVFVCGSQNFLNKLAEQLYDILDLRINKVYFGWRAYRLAYSTSDSIKILKYIYKDANGILLSRKYAIFKKFFLEYNKWEDEEVRAILNNHGAMVK